MKILYGTTNQAKISTMKRRTAPLNFEIIGLNDINMPLPAIDESGKSPLENAEIKSRAYYNAFKIPVFSCDSGLYFDGVDEDLQPGTHIRRINGKELNDDEMITYYSSLAADHGGELIARYRNAICLIIDDDTCFSSMDESLSGSPFKLVSQAHEKRVAGFPLDSLSINIATGEYYHDMTGRTGGKSRIDDGFKLFFEKALENIL